MKRRGVRSNYNKKLFIIVLVLIILIGVAVVAYRYYNDLDIGFSPLSDDMLKRCSSYYGGTLGTKACYVWISSKGKYKVVPRHCQKLTIKEYEDSSSNTPYATKTCNFGSICDLDRDMTILSVNNQYLLNECVDNEYPKSGEIFWPQYDTCYDDGVHVVDELFVEKNFYLMRWLSSKDKYYITPFEGKSVQLKYLDDRNDGALTTKTCSNCVECSGLVADKKIEVKDLSTANGEVNCINNGVVSVGECGFATSVCENGIREGSEICDGNDLGGQSCVFRGFASGELRCNSECNGFDEELCISAPICGQEIRITDESAVQVYPNIYDNKIVWMDSKNGNLDIYMYDISTGTETRVTTNSFSQRNPHVYDNKIVWQDERNSNQEDIYMYDILTGMETPISTNLFNQRNPSIYGDRIVYQDYRNGYPDIYMYNFITKVEQRITSQISLQFLPQIYGDRIVYQDYRNGNDDIYMYDLSNGVETSISTNSFGQYHPSIYGNKIVWHDVRNSNKDIYIYDISTGNELLITDNFYDQYNPSIYNNKIVWTDSRNGNLDIYMYDISTGVETPISTDAFDQSSPSIYGNKIVWEDNRNGNYDIYMYTIC